jgi:hypothetical protein
VPGAARHAPVEHLLHVVDGLHADPGAAGFVAGREAPAADFMAAAIGMQDFADTAGAQRDDGAGPAGVGAQHRGESVGFQRHGGVARVGGDEIAGPFLVVHAGQAQSDRDLRTRRLRQLRSLESARNGFLDGGPGILDAVQQAGWSSLSFAQQLAVGARQPHAGAAASAIDAYQEFNHFWWG